MASLQDLFEEQLKDLYSAENQLLKAMPKMAKKLSSEKLIAAFEMHRKQTEQQVERLSEGDLLPLGVEMHQRIGGHFERLQSSPVHPDLDPSFGGNQPDRIAQVSSLLDRRDGNRLGKRFLYRIDGAGRWWKGPVDDCRLAGRGELIHMAQIVQEARDILVNFRKV